MILKSLVLISSTLFAGTSMASLTLNKIPKEIKLEASTGGKVKGGSWSSKELVGKVHVLFYVAPNAEKLNQKARDAIKEAGFSWDEFASVAIINMEASNWPNFMISSKLASSQKENPHTQYVEDKKRVLVKEWHLTDNTSDVMAFDREGRVIFSVDGKLSDDQVLELVNTVRSAIAHKKPNQRLEHNQLDSKSDANSDGEPL